MTNHMPNDVFTVWMTGFLKWHQMNIQAYMHTMDCVFSSESLNVAPQVLTQMNPVTLWSNMFSDNSFAFNFGNSGSPRAEKAILRDVGSYGRQLGKMQDLMADMLNIPEVGSSLNNHKSVTEFQTMYNRIQKKKNEIKAIE